MLRFNDVNLTAGRAFAEIAKAGEQQQARLAAQKYQAHAEKDREEQARKDSELQAQADKDHDVGFIVGMLYAVAADLVGIAERTAQEDKTSFQLTAMTTYPRDLPDQKAKHFFFSRKKKQEAAKAREAAQHNAFSRVLTKDFINMPACRNFFAACHEQGVGVDLNSEGFMFLEFDVDVRKRTQAYEFALMRVAKREWREKFLRRRFPQLNEKSLQKHMEATAKKALAKGNINTWEDAFKILNEETERFIQDGPKNKTSQSALSSRRKLAPSINI